MGKVHSFIEPFKIDKEKTKSDLLEKLLYENGSIESDLRALIHKSALLRTEGARYRSLVRDPKEYQGKMIHILKDLAFLHEFLEYIAEKMPSRKKEIEDCLSQNRRYLSQHKNLVDLEKK